MITQIRSFSRSTMGRRSSELNVLVLAATMVFSLSSNPSASQEQTDRSIAKGPFEPAWESLVQNYKCPDWFRDAKFGIWAHWSAQCVPEQGDWYARHMYIQGNRQYEYHVKTYGHPSKFGFMEIDNLWKADKWEPEKLMAMYKRAGAKYFVALANHHDNFDAYDSKYHKWNSVNVGPKKDIVGIWARVARKNGLRFGVSNHSAHAWHWFQTAYGYDGEGPLAGVRYDAAVLTKEDGKGKWWEGLDPQELYTGPNIRIPDGISGAKAVAEWHDKNDRPWTEDPPAMNPGFTEKWFLRCQDLMDKYKPDLVYFDNMGLPLGQAGLDATAHYYNAGLKWHNGKIETVVTAKHMPPERRPALVEDIERGTADQIRPEPWQTCTCIGDWHYDRDVAEKNRYKSVNEVVDMLADIVSKNGNLLLSIPVRGNGTIDDHEIDFLKGMAKWMDVNGESIFETRPWKVFGEGPTQAGSGMFGESKNKGFTAEDIRFTTKGNILYAILLGWPGERAVVIKNLSANSPYASNQKIKAVALLGYKGKLEWSQDETGLTVKMPARAPCENAVVLKIDGLMTK
jgi:alpha-L-fucosidase